MRTGKLITKTAGNVEVEKKVELMHGTLRELHMKFSMFDEKMALITTETNDIGRMTGTFADLLAESSASLEEVNATIYATVADNEQMVTTLVGTMRQTRRLSEVQ